MMNAQPITLDDLAIMVQKGFAHVEERINTLEERIDGLEKRIGRLEERIERLEIRLTALEDRFNRFERYVENRFSALEQDLHALAKRTALF